MNTSSRSHAFTANEIKDALALLPHPEGGFFRETYRASGIIPHTALNNEFEGDRHHSTAIYYMLAKNDRSKLHRIRSDELWHHYMGGPLAIAMLAADGTLTLATLGTELASGQRPQIAVPAGCWFGAFPCEGTAFALVGCTVAPGFDFRDFEMANREQLLKQFPMHSDMINKLT